MRILWRIYKFNGVYTDVMGKRTKKKETNISFGQLVRSTKKRKS